MNTNEQQKQAIILWIERMRCLTESKLSPLDKIKQSIAISVDGLLMISVVRLISNAIVPTEINRLAEDLLDIRNSNESISKKSAKATGVILGSLKRLAWDDRGLKGRLAIGGGIVGAVIFGGQGAGIAALGTAIGVPLWLLFGAGAAVLGVVYEELTGNKSPPKTSYRIIDAELEAEDGPNKESRTTSAK